MRPMSRSSRWSSSSQTTSASRSKLPAVVTTAGSFDLLAEVVCEDDDHLLDLLMGRIRTLSGVTTTETFVYLKLNKQHYNWGTR